MTIRTSMKTTFLLVMGIALAFAISVGAQQDQDLNAPPAERHRALDVQVKAAQGYARPGNTLPANFLLVITDPETGAAITNLTQSNFQVISHGSMPGQDCDFTNNILAFGDEGDGAYLIKVVPRFCVWIQGDYMAQVMVRVQQRQGQAAVTLSVR